MSTALNTYERHNEPQGLKDGGHVIVRCSNCDKPLVDLWRTRPNLTDPRTGKLFEWKFIAQCCYCNNQSYITTVLGGVHIGGYGVTTYENIKENIINTHEKTSVIETTTMPGREDVTLIKTARCG